MINNTVQFNSKPLSASFLQAASKYKPGPGTLNFGQPTPSQTVPTTRPVAPVVNTTKQTTPTATPTTPTVPNNAASILANAKSQLQGIQGKVNGLMPVPKLQHISTGTSANPSSGFPSYVSQTAQASQPNATQTGLISNLQNTAQGNQAYAQRAQEIANQYAPQIQKIGFLGAGAQAGDLSTGSNVVGSGNAAIASQSASQRAQALVDAENAALAGNAQGLTAQQQQAGALNQALGGANTQQAQQIGGLGTAAGLAQPSTAAYGQTVFNPLTGQYEGGGGLPPEVMSQYAQMAANGQYAAIPTSITSNPVLSAQLNQQAQQINPNFNPIASQAQGAAQAQNIQTLGTAGSAAAANLTGQLSSLQASANGAEQNFQLLTNIAQRGGVNNYDQPILNQLQQNVSKGLVGNDAVINFKSLVQSVRSQYAAILGGGNTTVESLQEAQSLVPDTISVNSLKTLGQNLKSDAQNRIGGIQQQINQLSGQSNTGNQSVQVPSGAKTITAKAADGNSYGFYQDANGVWHAQ